MDPASAPSRRAATGRRHRLTATSTSTGAVLRAAARPAGRARRRTAPHRRSSRAPRSSPRSDAVTVPWARRSATSTRLRPAARSSGSRPGLTRGADMVVVEQASRLLLNYVLLLGRERAARASPSGDRVCNVLPQRASPVGEAVKRFVSRRVDWWFAYNERASTSCWASGSPPYRITCVQNAIDTRALASCAQASPRPSSSGARRRSACSSAARRRVRRRALRRKAPRLPVAAVRLVRASSARLRAARHRGRAGDAGAAAAAATRPWLHSPARSRDREVATTVLLGPLPPHPARSGWRLSTGSPWSCLSSRPTFRIRAHEIEYFATARTDSS